MKTTNQVRILGAALIILLLVGMGRLCLQSEFGKNAQAAALSFAHLSVITLDGVTSVNAINARITTLVSTTSDNASTSKSNSIQPHSGSTTTLGAAGVTEDVPGSLQSNKLLVHSGTGMTIGAAGNSVDFPNSVTTRSISASKLASFAKGGAFSEDFSSTATACAEGANKMGLHACSACGGKEELLLCNNTTKVILYKAP